MKVIITTEVLQSKGLTLQDFGVLLTYMYSSTQSIADSSKKLWEKGLLTKELMGYSFNHATLQEIESWFAESNIEKLASNRYTILADKLRELFPEGKKPGTNYMWRDNTITIAKKLKTLCTKFETQFTDEEAIDATKRYIESFNGDYSYMQLLKYFILKRDNNKMEETSQLLSYIQNEDATASNDNGELI